MKIRRHNELKVYKMSFEAAMEIFSMTRSFPKSEVYALTDQIRRSSRSVAANIGEAFRKRYYPKVFVSKLSDSEAEAAETQIWLEFSLKCEYINQESFERLTRQYDEIISILVSMRLHSNQWSP